MTPAPLARGPSERRGPFRRVAALVWLAFVVIPLVDALSSRHPALPKALVVGLSGCFVAVYIGTVVGGEKPAPLHRGLRAIAVLFALSAALALADRAEWAFLFVYCAAAAAIVLPQPWSYRGVGAATVLAAATRLAHHTSLAALIGVVTPTVGIGLLVLLLADLRERNRELSEARAELARLAVAEERERFARDLHDLLGHSLSVIALKAELAGRLLRADPVGRADDAVREVVELEQVARGALSEVRDAVSGYRRPTLAGELEGARMALSAAGIEAVVDAPAVALDPEVEAALAWTVREGATNVIRHSRARRCTITLRAGLADAEVDVVDDGVGAAALASASAHGDGAPPVASASAEGGHGIEGLRERVTRLGGTLDAAARPGGGFRLAAWVPLIAPVVSGDR